MVQMAGKKSQGYVFSTEMPDEVSKWSLKEQKLFDIKPDKTQATEFHINWSMQRKPARARMWELIFDVTYRRIWILMQRYKAKDTKINCVSG